MRAERLDQMDQERETGVGAHGEGRGHDDDHDKPHAPEKVTVLVYDLDSGGEPISVRSTADATVRSAVATVYRELNTTPDPADRLLCKCTGDPVGQHADLHLGEYLERLCQEKVWTFTRDTGGA